MVSRGGVDDQDGRQDNKTLAETGVVCEIPAVAIVGAFLPEWPVSDVERLG